MIFVYLDQNHLSSFAKRRLKRMESEPVAILEQRLLDLVAAERVCCPFSAFHVYETVAYDDQEARDEVCRVIGELSRGVCLRHHLDRVEDQLRDYIARSTLEKPSDVLTAEPFGRNLDCFPRTSTTERTRAFVDEADEHSSFARIVELGRATEEIKNAAAAFKAALHELENEQAEVRDRDRVPIAQVRTIEMEAILGTDEVEGLIRHIGEEHGVQHPLFRDMVVAEKLRTQYTLAAMVEVQARRRVAFGMKPHPGDPMDAAHLSALAHVQVFATDRRSAGIARDAGRLFGCTVVRRAEDALEAIEAALSRERP